MNRSLQILRIVVMVLLAMAAFVLFKVIAALFKIYVELVANYEPEPEPEPDDPIEYGPDTGQYDYLSGHLRTEPLEGGWAKGMF